MDKKSLIGLLIIGVILFGFTWYNAKKQAEFAAQQAAVDSMNMIQNQPLSEPLVQGDPKGEIVPVEQGDSALRRHIGSYLFTARNASEELYTIENDLARYTISNRGGRIVSVELKDYTTYDGSPLIMFEPESSQFDLSFFIKQGFGDSQIITGDYAFTTDQPQTVVLGENDEEKQFTMRLTVDSASYIEYVYTIRKDNYMVGFAVNFVGMSQLLSNQSDIEILWRNVSPQNEKGFENENNYTTIAYMYPGQDDLEDLGMSKSTKEENVDTKIHWVAFKQQFFSSVLIADNDFQNGELRYNTFEPGEGKIKDFYAKLSVPFSAQTQRCDFQMYYGPNKYSVLKKYDNGMQRLVPLGGWLVGWINRWIVIPVFDFLGKYIANYGLIILLLTIFIKIIIAPLTYKSYLSSAKMRLLKPDIDALNAKYPDQKDAMKKQQAIMTLYKEAGVSPMGGCLPLLIQFPILIAMFRFFPASIELRGEHFLWADDLSSYDSILQLPFNIPFYGSHVSLFALLMALSVFISSKINYSQTAQAGPQLAGMKFMMLYMMPIMLLLWFNNYSSGLSYYYLVSNIFTIGQTFAFRYAVNDEKLHQQMKENAKKPKKKSRWQQRYEELLKEQQKQQQQMRNRR